MRVHGEELSGSFTRSILLSRPDGSTLALTLQPLPLGFHRRLRSCGVVPPQPPVRVARESGGQPLRDGNGHALTLRDETDPAHLAALELYHQRVAVLAVAESLKADGSVQFDAREPAATDGTAWAAYADAIFAELERAGFTAGDLAHLCSYVSRMSRLIDDDLRKARGNFSSEAAVA
jgi:hypothetical protein